MNAEMIFATASLQSSTQRKDFTNDYAGRISTPYKDTRKSRGDVFRRIGLAGLALMQAACMQFDFSQCTDDKALEIQARVKQNQEQGFSQEVIQEGIDFDCKIPGQNPVTTQAPTN